jgi:predicted Zn-dependent protease
MPFMLNHAIHVIVRWQDSVSNIIRKISKFVNFVVPEAEVVDITAETDEDTDDVDKMGSCAEEEEET